MTQACPSGQSCTRGSQLATQICAKPSPLTQAMSGGHEGSASGLHSAWHSASTQQNAPAAQLSTPLAATVQASPGDPGLGSSGAQNDRSPFELHLLPGGQSCAIRSQSSAGRSPQPPAQPVVGAVLVGVPVLAPVLAPVPLLSLAPPVSPASSRSVQATSARPSAASDAPGRRARKPDEVRHMRRL